MLRQVAFILLTALLLAGCGPSQAEKDLLMQAVRTRAQALNARDLGLYVNVISPSYSDKRKGFAQVREGLEAAFKLYEQVSFEEDDQKVHYSGQQAEVSGTYRMKVVIRGHEMVLDGKEHLVFTREPDGWKIIAGL
jgi:hypothetical protein